MKSNKLTKDKNTLGQLPFPTTLAFEPIQLCNAACYCCPYTWLRDDKKYHGKRMSTEQISTLLDDFGGIRERHGYDGVLSISPYRFSDPLVCKDLELILQKAEKYSLDVTITTNGVALSKKNLEILSRYHFLFSKINVSLIGSTADEVSKYMGIKFEKVFSNLEHVAEKWPMLNEILRVSLRRVNESPEEHERLAELKDRLQSVGLFVKNIKKGWITNRVDAQKFLGRDTELKKMPPRDQTSDRFVAGCGWVDNLLSRMEVMVDGDVVLCCDDAEKHKVFGNVFDEGIESIWRSSLRKEHQVLINNHFSDEKRSLICSTCSRAIWNDREDPWLERLRYRNASLEQTVRKMALESRKFKS